MPFCRNFFFFNDTATTEIYTLSLHDALPISRQRLLQQHELRLDLDVEPPRRLEQLHQHAAERDVLQRPVEDRLAHRADLAFQFVDPCLRRYPSRFEVRGGDA